MKKISTTKAPAAIGPYSQAVIVNGILYTSGQIPIDPRPVRLWMESRNRRFRL